jgi:peroxiredoxin
VVTPFHTTPAVYQDPRTTLKRFSAATGLIILLCLPVLMVTLLQRADKVRQLQPCELIPVLKLMSLDSTQATVLDLDGKRAALLFFSVDCPRCQMEISNFEQLSMMFKDECVFVAISSGDSPRTKNFVNARRISFPVFLDENAQVRRTFGVVEVPTLFLVNGSRVIVYRGSGAEPLEIRRRQLTAFLHNELQQAK